MKKVLFTFALLLGLSGTVCAQQYYVFREATPSGDSLWFIYQSGSTDAFVFGGYLWTGSGYRHYSQYSNWGGVSGDLIIPSTVRDSFNVDEIGPGAFLDLEGLTSVTIPNSVTVISVSAFSGCNNLTTVNIPSSVTAIGDDAFSDCNNLTIINIPSSVTYIGACAFLGCWNRTTVNIPSSVTDIGEYAFAGVRHIEHNGSSDTYGALSVNGVVENGFVYSDSDVARHHLLAYCGTDSSVTIPPTVDTINFAAFIGYKRLYSVSIPKSVTSINALTFAHCTNLSSITIGSEVASIGGAAFYNCNHLTEIHSFCSGAPQLGSFTASEYDAAFYGLDAGNTNGVFDGVPSTIPVYIPCGSSGSYYGRWSYFSNFIEDEAFTFNAESADNNMGAVQILTMPTCTAPNAVLYASANSGYHFDHWSTGSTSNPYTLTVISDTVITAYFAADGGGTEGIGDVDSSGILIHAQGGNVVIEGVEDETVQVFDMVGRPVGTQSLSTGIYMVKIGTLPARRVAVIR